MHSYQCQMFDTLLETYGKLLVENDLTRACRRTRKEQSLCQVGAALPVTVDHARRAPPTRDVSSLRGSSSHARAKCPEAVLWSSTRRSAGRALRPRRACAVPLRGDAPSPRVAQANPPVEAPCIAWSLAAFSAAPRQASANFEIMPAAIAAFERSLLMFEATSSP